MGCPPIDHLFALARNILPAGEATSVQAHLDTGCRACHRQLSQLREILSLTEDWMLQEPPAWLLRRALAVFDRPPTPRPSLLKVILGILVADNFGEEILLGFRRSRRTSRQMLFRAGDYDIDLCINYDDAPGSIELTGQANPLSGDLQVVVGAEVALLQHTEVVAATKANQFGAFFIDGVPEGVYHLRIRLKDEEIQIDGVDGVSPSR